MWEEYIETTGRMCIEVGPADGGVGVLGWELLACAPVCCFFPNFVKVLCCPQYKYMQEDFSSNSNLWY